MCECGPFDWTFRRGNEVRQPVHQPGCVNKNLPCANVQVLNQTRPGAVVNSSVLTLLPRVRVKKVFAAQ